MDDLDTAHRQVDELAAVEFTGKATFHFIKGICRQITIEASLFREGEQQFLLLPPMGHGSE